MKNMWSIAGTKVFDEIIEAQHLDFSMKKAMPLLTLPFTFSIQQNENKDQEKFA